MNIPLAVKTMLLDPGILDELTIRGDSMHPTLKNGQKIRQTELIEVPKLLPGRIYVFISGQQLIVHRFVSTIKKKHIFLGDNSIFADTVRNDWVLAKYSRNESLGFIKNICLFNLLIVNLPMKLRNPIFILKKLYIRKKL